MNALAGLTRFHTGAGARVAQRNSILALCLILFVLRMAPDPLLDFIRFVVLATGSAATGPGGTLALGALMLGLARQGARTLVEGSGGWIRSLPGSGVDHRRAIA